MSNRFKFRAWCVNDKEMHYDAESTYDFGCSGVHIMTDHFGALIDNPDYILEQCTGVKDKNGNLVYEGDILCKEYKSTKGMMCLVEPYINGWWLKPLNKKRGFIDNIVIIKEMQVVGNIHENEELLNEPK